MEHNGWTGFWPAVQTNPKPKLHKALQFSLVSCEQSSEQSEVNRPVRDGDCIFVIAHRPEEDDKEENSQLIMRSKSTVSGQVEFSEYGHHLGEPTETEIIIRSAVVRKLGSELLLEDGFLLEAVPGGDRIGDGAFICRDSVENTLDEDQNLVVDEGPDVPHGGCVFHFDD